MHAHMHVCMDGCVCMHCVYVCMFVLMFVYVCIVCVVCVCVCLHSQAKFYCVAAVTIDWHKLPELEMR